MSRAPTAGSTARQSIRVARRPAFCLEFGALRVRLGLEFDPVRKDASEILAAIHPEGHFSAALEQSGPTGDFAAGTLKHPERYRLVRQHGAILAGPPPHWVRPARGGTVRGLRTHGPCR